MLTETQRRLTVALLALRNSIRSLIKIQVELGRVRNLQSFWVIEVEKFSCTKLKCSD
jgi:hypothetical protein